MSILKANRIENLTTTDGGININNSGKVGIGTDSPGQDLTIKRTGGQTQVTLMSDTDQSGAIYFGDTASTARGVIEYDHSSDFMRLYTSGSERMRILSDGTIRLASGCPGIDFSQIQTNASGMSSETLDSYEEGTFTPIDGSSASLTLAVAAGIYTKIGRMVHVQCRVKYPSTSNTQFASVGGFPFTATNQSTDISNGSNASGVGYTNLGYIPLVHMSASGTHTNWYNLSTIIRNSDLSGKEIRFGVVYSTT